MKNSVEDKKKYALHVCLLQYSFKTLIFLFQGKFYELYELDAEIGHKELDWKMTLSGVGKCRQVMSRSTVIVILL